MAYSATGSFNGLTTVNLGVPITGNYSIQGNITLPTISEGELTNSQLVVTIKINGGTTIFTSNPGDKGFEVKHPMTAGDIFNVAFASAAVVDQTINCIRSTIP